MNRKKNISKFLLSKLDCFYFPLIIKSNITLYNFMIVHSSDRITNSPYYRNIYFTNILESNSPDNKIDNWPFLKDDDFNYDLSISLKDRFLISFKLK